MTSPAITNVPLWTKSYTLTVLATLFIFIPWALFLPVLPVYVMKELHGSPASAGAASGVFFIAMALFRVQTDWFERKFGKRAVLFAGGLLFACLNALYFLAGTTRTLLLICFLSGACFAVLNTSLIALAAEIIPPSRKGEGLGYVSTAVTVATAVGPFTGLLLAKGYGFGWVFSFCSLIAVVGSFITLGIAIPVKASRKPVALRSFALGEILEARAIPYSLVILLLMFAISAVLSFVSVYAMTLHLQKASALFFVVLALCAICSRLLTGRIFDRWGADFIIYPAILSLATGLLVLGRVHSSFSMFAAAVLVGISYGIVVPNLQALAYKRSPPQRTSVVTATYYTLFDLGIGSGSYAVGLSLGYAKIYLVLSPLILSVALLYRVTCSKEPDPINSYNSAGQLQQNRDRAV